MTVRTIVSLAIVSALLVPVSVSATQAEPVAINAPQPVVGLTMSVDGEAYTFRFVGPTGTFSTEPKTLKIATTATGFTVSMTDGKLRISALNKNATLTNTPHLFKSLSFSFANGKIQSWTMDEVTGK